MSQIYRDNGEIIVDYEHYKPHNSYALMLIAFGFIYVFSMGFMMYEIESLNLKLRKAEKQIETIQAQHDNFKLRFGVGEWE